MKFHEKGRAEMKRFRDWLRNAFLVIYFLTIAAIIISLEVIFRIHIWNSIARHYDVVVQVLYINIIVFILIAISLFIFRK